MKILLIANYEEGVGGISVQVKLQRDLLRGDGFVCDILSTKGSVAKRIKAFFALLSKGRKYDLFHIHACSDRGFLPAILGINIGRLLKKRIVLTFHGGGAEGFFHRKEKFVKRYLTRTSANIVLSRFIGRVFDRYGIPYTVIPNILVADGSTFRARTEIRPRFIGIRSLTDTYNIKCTLKAFDSVQKKYPDARLTLLGGGPLKAELEQFVVEHHICRPGPEYGDIPLSGRGGYHGVVSPVRQYAGFGPGRIQGWPAGHFQQRGRCPLYDRGWPERIAFRK